MYTPGTLRDVKRTLIAAVVAIAAVGAAIVIGAGSIAGPRGKPGPVLAPLPITTAALATIVADTELAEGDGFRRRIVFGRRFANANPHDFRAAIVIFDGPDAHEVPLSPDFDGLAWEHAARSSDGKTIWALADNAAESPGWTMELVSSDDAGATWRHLSTVPKPYYWGQFETFQMSKAGIGLVGIRLGTSAPAPAEDDGRLFSKFRALFPAGDATGDEQPEGLYVYRTKDGGLTWTGPQYFEDDTEDAWEPVEPIPPGFGAVP